MPGSQRVVDLHVGEISPGQVVQFLCWPFASDGHRTALQRFGDHAAVVRASTPTRLIGHLHQMKHQVVVPGLPVGHPLSDSIEAHCREQQ